MDSQTCLAKMVQILCEHFEIDLKLAFIHLTKISKKKKDWN